MRLIGYARLSKQERSGTQVGLDVQRSKMEAYCLLYGHTLTAILEDFGESGKSMTHRPSLGACLSALRSGEAEGLLVYKLDRLTRSLRDIQDLLADFFGHAAKTPRALLSVTDQFDTSTAIGRFVLNMTIAISQWEREAIGERTRAALQEKASQGMVLGRPRRALIDPTRIADVRRMRGLRADGATFEEIAAALDAGGSKPWGKSLTWDASSVRYTLANARLVGEEATTCPE